MQKIGAELTMSQHCANDISQLLSQRHATAKLVACVLILVGISKTVASGSSSGREAQLYESTASIAGRKCNAQ